MEEKNNVRNGNIRIKKKLQKVYNEIDTYTRSYKYLEKENEKLQKEDKLEL